MEAPPRDGASALFTAAALAVVALAAWTRLYALDVPSLWWDEILVPLNARAGLGTLFARCATQDFHPPGLYLLTKLAMQAGTGNAVLRLPPVLASLAAVWLMYRLGRRWLGPGAALIAAALLASSDIFLLVSRQVRPYGPMVCLSVAAVHFLLRHLEDGRGKWLWFCLAACVAGLWLHYSAVLLAGSVWVVLAARSVADGNWKTPLRFGLGLAAGALSIAPFLGPSLLREPGVVQGAGRLDLLGLMVLKLGELLRMDPPHWPRAALACAALAGLAHLALRRRELGLAFLLLFVSPLAALLAAAYGTYFNPWHLLFLAPSLFWSAGHALALALRRRELQALFAVGLCAACAWQTLEQRPGRFYAEESNTGIAQGVARAVAGRVGAGALFMPPDVEFWATSNWYLDRFADPNPQRAQRLGPDDAEALLVYVTDGRYWIFAENERKVLASMPRPEIDESWARPSPQPGPPLLERVRRLQWRIARDPAARPAALPYAEERDFHPARFLAVVHALQDVCIHPMDGFALAATTPGRAGHADFAYEMPPGSAARALELSLNYANTGPGHRLRALASFDGGPFEELFASTGRDAARQGTARMDKAGGFSRLTLRFELFTAPGAPAYHGEPLNQLLLKGFSLRLSG